MTGIRFALLLAVLCVWAPIAAFPEDRPGNNPSPVVTHGPGESTEDCTPVPQTLPEVPLATVVPQCMAERRPTRDPVVLIDQDLRVCQCLQDRNALFPNAVNNQNSDVNPELQKQELMRTFIQSSANVNALNTLSDSSTNENAATSMLTSGEAEFRKRSLTRSVNTVSSNLKTNEPVTQTPAAIQRVTTPQISSTITQQDSIAESQRNQQCVTYLEYSSQRELPYDNSFFSYLSSTNSFVANDWNMDSLRQAYDTATTTEQKNSIYSRMVYLSRNPRFAAVFNATRVEGVSAAVINQKKIDLFNILRRLAPPSGSTCAQTQNQCWQEAQASGSYREFSSQAERFMLQNDVMDIVSSTMADRYESEVRRIMEGTPDSLIPRTPTGYAAYLQSTEEEIANGCTGPSAQATCYERFSGHCKQIRKIHKVATSNTATSGADVMEELSASQVVHGLLNPQQNQNFAAFNDLICLQEYKNAAGQSSNFFEFRNRTCPATNPPAECSDRRALLSRFLNEYTTPLSGANPGDQNVRTGFAAALTRPGFVQMTAAQFDTINRIAESPRVLRAQNGGRMPTVAANGQLIAPTGSTSRTATPAPKSPAASSSPTAAYTPAPQAVTDATTPTSTSGSTETRTPSRRLSADDDRDSYRPSSATNFNPSSLPGPAAANLIPRNNPQLPSLPQLRPPQDNVLPPERRPASEEERTESTRVPAPASVSGGGTVAVSAGGDSPAPTGRVSSGSGSLPQVELPPRRRRSANADNIRGALLQKYENVTESRGTQQQQELNQREAVPVAVDADTVSAVINDPNSLSSNEAVMAAVNGSSEPIVKISLSSGEGTSPVVVYASRNNGQVNFSFTPPSGTPSDRAPASLGENEMNVRVPDREFYERVSANPSALSGYESVVKSAASLPGDVVRLNIVINGEQPIYVYVDKRGPRPVFTIDDQRIIRAYRP